MDRLAGPSGEIRRVSFFHHEDIKHTQEVRFGNAKVFGELRVGSRRDIVAQVGHGMGRMWDKWRICRLGGIVLGFR